MLDPLYAHFAQVSYFLQTLQQYNHSKTCLKGPLKNKQNKDLNDKW